MITTLNLPYPPLIIIESDKELSWDNLCKHIKDKINKGVSICLISEKGEEDRGGYFFHFKKTKEGIVFTSFDRTTEFTLRDENAAIKLINHASGRKYDEEMWALSQKINLRTDKYM
jgi:hypothetical protein